MTLHGGFIIRYTREKPLPDAPSARKGLLFKITKFRVLAYFTECERHGERADLALEYAIFAGMTHERDASEVLEAREQLELILSALSEDQYEVFTTKVLEGLKVCDVAAQLGMKENTARGYLSKALETLRERLERLEHPGLRSLLILLGISSVVALADTASAMVGRVKRFFSSFARTSFRGVLSAATAAFVMVVPPKSGASAEHAANAEQTSSRAAMNAITPPEVPSSSRTPDKPAAEVVPSVLPVSTPARPKAIPRRDEHQASPVKTAPPDHLLSKAIIALRNGQPEKALEVLDQYPENDLKWADELRARAKQSIAMKKHVQ